MGAWATADEAVETANMYCNIEPHRAYSCAPKVCDLMRCCWCAEKEKRG